MRSGNHFLPQVTIGAVMAWLEVEQQFSG